MAIAACAGPTPPSVAPQPSESGGAIPDPSRIGWVAGGAVTERIGGDLRTTGLRVFSGTLSGRANEDFTTSFPPRPLEVDVWAAPFVSQPRSNTATVGAFDGIRSELWTLDLVSGASRVVLDTPDAVTAAMWMPESEEVYLVASDPEGRPLGVFLSPTGGSEPARRLLDPVGRWADRPPGSFDRLLVTADERFVLHIACTGEACAMRWMDQQTGDTREIADLDYGVVIGLAERALYFSGLPAPVRERCGLACPVLAVDLGTGVAKMLGVLCLDEAAVAASGAAGLLVLANDPVCGAPAYTVTATGAETGAVANVDIPPGSRLVAATGAGEVLIEPLAKSWVMTSDTGEDAWVVDRFGQAIAFEPAWPAPAER